jgi:hypothetical protein
MVKPGDIAPFCECGCGEQVKTRKSGVWSRWRPGHHYGTRVGRPDLKVIK